MGKKKLAIISTWNEVCGIAHYASYLKKALDDDYEIEVLSVPRKIFDVQSPNSKERAIADKRIDEICLQLCKFDVVNIQFEPGLFGTSVSDIIRRVKKLIYAGKELVITFHSIKRSQEIKASVIIKNILRFRLKTVYHQLRAYAESNKWNSLLKYINRLSKKKKISAITHTQRDKFYLSLLAPDLAVFDVPLIYLSKHDRENLPAVAASTLLQQRIPYPKENIRYIGVFGFISDYKGYIYALKALNFLPTDYELLIFGSLHEGHLTHRMGTHPFVSELVDYVEAIDKKQNKEKRKFSDRVHFMGTVSDDELLCGMMLCDAVLFPYINSEQTASGPISLAIELNRYILASKNLPFIELTHYYKDKFEFCDIGNYIEIAQKSLRAKEQIVKEANINGMRWVYFNEREGSLFPEYTLKVYKNAIEPVK